MNLPPILSPCFDAMPAELTQAAQWVVWRAVWQADTGKYNKVPVNARTGKNASSTNPATWCDFDTAQRAYERNPAPEGNPEKGYAGVGFVLSKADPFAGVDLDHVIDPATGELSGAATETVAALDTYAEVSPSGTGVRLFLVGTLPPDGRKRGDVEMYEHGRFLTVTGHKLPNAHGTVNERQAELAAFHAVTFAPATFAGTAPFVPNVRRGDRSIATPRIIPRGIDSGPRVSGGASFTGDRDRSDADLLAVAFTATNGAKIAALYGGDTAGYPGASEADFALCGLLAFYTGNEPARLDALFRGSGLMRPKWDEKHYASGATYGHETVRRAIAGCANFYTEAVLPGNLGDSVNIVNFVTRKGVPETPETAVPGGYRGIGGINTTPPLMREIDKIDKIEEWGEPVPFGTDNLPAFPVDALPDTLRDFALATAQSVGTPIDLPAVQLLAAVAAAVQKRVRVKGRDGHIEPCTLWCISVAAPGSRKSAIMAKVRAPFARFEVAENERLAPQVMQSESEERLAKLRLDHAERKSARDRTPEAEEELLAAQTAVKALRPVRPVRLLIDDATPESAAVLMSENNGRLAVLDAEGTVFGHMTGRYTDKPAIEIFLKSFNGETFTQDRAGKERRSVQVRNPALTLGVTIQPVILSGLRQKRDFAGVGALARCLFSFVTDNGEGDTYDAPPVDTGAETAYHALIDELLALSPSFDKAGDGEYLPYALTLTPEAFATFSGFYTANAVEIRQAGGGGFAEWRAKLHGAVLRIAGVLHMAQEGTQGVYKPIDAQTLLAAVTIGGYFVAHAKGAFAQSGDGEASEGARRILNWIKRNRGKVADLIAAGGVSLRDLERQLHLEPEEANAALAVLAVRGYAQPAPVPAPVPGKAGRKPSAKWLFNPVLFDSTPA